MKKLTFAMLLLVTMLLLVLTGCPAGNTNADSDTEADTEENLTDEIERTRITEPDGVMFSINDMPVTKAAFDEAFEMIKPGPEIGLFRAFSQHFLPQTTIEKQFPKELGELKKEMEDILARVKAGEMTFDEAISEYSDDPGKDMNSGLMEAYGPASAYYAIDEAIFELDEGEISDPVVTPFGIMAFKMEKINKDIDDELVSVDFKQIMLTLDRYLEDDKQIMMELQPMMMESKIEFKDMSLAKELPDFYFLGTPPEEMEQKQKEFEEMEEPETNWRDLPDDTVVVVMNDRELTAGEVKKVSDAMMPSTRDIYNIIINSYFKDNLQMLGWFKEYHDDVTSELTEIKNKIESGEITFDEAIEEYSMDPGQEDTLVYEDITRGQFVPQFEEVMFSIPLNEVSDPFLTRFGGHIIEVVGETKNEDGERETADVRHILIDWEKYLDPENPNAMYQEKLKMNRDTEVKVYDSYIHSLLPMLGEKKEPEPVPEPAANEGSESE